MGAATQTGLKLAITFTVICTAHFLVDFMIGIWPIYKLMVDLNLAQAGLIVAFAAFFGEGSQIIFGPLGDKGYRKWLVIFGVLAAASSAFLAFSRDYYILFGIYLMTCIGSGAFHPTAAGIVSHLIPHRSAFLMTLFTASGYFGLALSQIIFANIFSFFDGNTLILLLPTVLLAVFLLFFPFPSLKRMTDENTPGVSEFIKFFQRRDLRHLYLSQLANQSLICGIIFILPNVLKTFGHAHWICYGGGHLCFIFGSALMMMPGGFLADKYSARRVLLYSNGAAFTLFYIFIFFGGISSIIVLPLLWLMGASLGANSPVAIAFGNKLVPDNPGVISAYLMGLVWCFSQILGSAGTGILSGLFTDYAPVKALAVLGALFFVAIYSTYFLPREASYVRARESIQ